MAHQVLNALDIRPGGCGHCCGGVSEIVGAGIRPSDPGGDPLEVGVERVYCQVLPRGIGENQIVRVVPILSGGKLILRLAGPLRPEVLEGNLWRLDLAGLPALGGRGDVVPCPLLFLLLELLADGDPLGLEVHLIPGQAQAFPLSQPGKQTQGKSVAHRMTIDSGQESGDLFIGQRVDLLYFQNFSGRNALGVRGCSRGI